MFMRKKVICCLAAGMLLVCLLYGITIHSLQTVPAAQNSADPWIELKDPATGQNPGTDTDTAFLYGSN